ncbi:MAG: sugar phosphate nucleotidyltransferase [Acidimicrobiales bacterium]
MKLVLLAAGHGRRFGGLKQIASVGPRGEAIMDYTVQNAQDAGYDGVVVVVREEIREEITRHVAQRWDLSIPVEVVVQAPRPGTAYAVLCARPVVGESFAVANADDLYESDALALIRRHFSDGAATRVRHEHVLVAYELGKTVLTDAEVKRGICRLGADGRLEGVAEHKVRLREDGDFDAMPLDHALARLTTQGRPARLGRGVPVSMNLWGFSPAIFDVLSKAVASFEPDGPDAEILLPEVVGRNVASGAISVHVDCTRSRCYGVTHREDVDLVRDHLEVAEGDALEWRGAAANFDAAR